MAKRTIEGVRNDLARAQVPLEKLTLELPESIGDRNMLLAEVRYLRIGLQVRPLPRTFY